MPIAAWESRLTEIIQLACLLEAAARKPGNVHPHAAFDNLDFNHFVTSSRLIAPVLAESSRMGIGAAVLQSCQTMMNEVGGNTHLGTILLLAPLAAVPARTSLKSGIAEVLGSLDVHDAKLVYEAIALVNPGGMGSVAEQDIASRPTRSLLEVMSLAAERDTVARQYFNGYRDVFHYADWMVGCGHTLVSDWETEIIRLQLKLMAEIPDTLIARKCGLEIAEEAARRAASVLESEGWEREQEGGQTRLGDFDQWLRADGHRRNPGTTADLVTAVLFCLLRDQPQPSIRQKTWNDLETQIQQALKAYHE